MGPTPPDDDQLIRRFQAGDEAVFGELVERWAQDLLRLAWRLTGSPEEAEEIRQEALVRVWRGLETFDGRSRPRTWLYRITVNLWRDRLRRGERQGRTADAARERARTRPAAPSSAQLSGEREDTARVAAAVLALPAELRAVVVLRHYHDLSFREIAGLTGSPVTTVQTRMARGLDRLRQRLGRTTPHQGNAR